MGINVAPSRARGLKRIHYQFPARSHSRRALTGAWIETVVRSDLERILLRRALTGAWIETPALMAHRRRGIVAPSRARGLKQDIEETYQVPQTVAPSRARGLKLQPRPVAHPHRSGRALTGAWIETDTCSTEDSNITTSRPHGRVD